MYMTFSQHKNKKKIKHSINHKDYHMTTHFEKAGMRKLGTRQPLALPCIAATPLNKIGERDSLPDLF